MDLASNMRSAWLARQERAAADLAAVRKAPALFKPEFVSRAIEAHAKATAELARWSA